MQKTLQLQSWFWKITESPYFRYPAIPLLAARDFPESAQNLANIWLGSQTRSGEKIELPSCA